jgi:hypothetical protein
MHNAAVDAPPRPPAPRSCLGTSLAVVGLLASGLFLANPTMGVLFELPDNLPGVGNLDEVLASAIFFSCLSYLGIRLPFLGMRRSESPRLGPPPSRSSGE